MFKEEFFASRADLMLFPQLAFGLFMLVFLGVLVWVFLGLRDKGKLHRIASLPLEDDSNGGSLND
ncbi:MAG: hypothetical protein QF492_01765 [Candidatus Krumholzibacteria bacterium]|jgi:cbb3-type cytochrome oxidase subunit 3|nr:hypothetical protein [Candidatus Krumholzibacteria bacterium]MDP6668621.1 hypothetical protein [Candidatus Krumholzibacteria bacterium]MDP6797713.1 hypothetical protein [Candidatus Krumholzibacteria bacterium]MDP7022311.1 hypothetical protein [Candidatus Krumholzibacteria bacterium]